MKQRRYRLVFTVLAAVLVASGFVSCSKSEMELPTDDSRAINLKANVQATTNTKAVVVGTTFPANTDNVFRLTAFSGAVAPTDWSARPYFDDIQVNSGAASALTFAANQYYPANGDKVFFYGYAPQATSLTAGTAATAPIANYTITGQQDIMAAQEISGIAAATTGIQPQPALAFTHKLMQLRFKVVKDASFELGKKVTEILVQGVKTSAKLDITTGALTFDGAADQNLPLPITAGTNDEITAGGTNMDGCVMSEPVGTGGSVTLQVTADGVVYDNINVALTGTNAGTAGTSYLITLTFKRTGITPKASITDWQSPVDQDADIDGDGLFDAPTVGDYYYTDGSYSPTLNPAKTVDGLIFYVDPTNHLKFKVMSMRLAQSSLGYILMEWAAKRTYVIGTDAQSNSDGQANVAAIKKYSEDHAYDTNADTKTTGDFATDFPAAFTCYDYKGESSSDRRGTWYLPSKNDLQYLYCAYNGAAPTTWENGNVGAPAANETARNRWNGLLSAVSGANTIEDDYWSSTEYEYDDITAWFLDASNAIIFNERKDYANYVRCIRDHTVPVASVDAVGDYYYTDGTHSPTHDPAKTVNGLVFYVDPTNHSKFKVMSLDEKYLAWIGENASEYYDVPGARSLTDGKANSDAVKAFYDAKNAEGLITTTFKETFPAFEYCYNYTGKDGNDPVGSWYLPAIHEVQELYCAVNGYMPIYWTPTSYETGYNLDALPVPAAQGVFNAYLTKIGATNIQNTPYDRYLSGTQGGYDPSYFSANWLVDFGDGWTFPNDLDLGGYVRCVRSL